LGCDFNFEGSTVKKAAYPIRAVSRMTGLSIDTLRAWERRYSAVEPQRGERGRSYDEADIARLRKLKSAVDRGYSIGRIATMSDEQLSDLLERHQSLSRPLTEDAVRPDNEAMLGNLLRALADFDWTEVDRELGRLALLLTPRELIHKAVIPLMNSVGTLWHTGEISIAQEHMTSATLRNLLGALIRLYVRRLPGATLVFATPSGERHEFGILAGAMLAASGGLGAVYLGPDLPAEEIARTAVRVNAKCVVLGWKAANGFENSLAEIRTLTKLLPKKMELWIGGTPKISEIGTRRAREISDFAELEKQLSRIGARYPGNSAAGSRR
jgi:DNA-binding transcriptional MerR regulator